MQCLFQSVVNIDCMCPAHWIVTKLTAALSTGCREGGHFPFLCNTNAYCCIAELCVYGYWIVTFLI
jgi:hypothetical protein